MAQRLKQSFPNVVLWHCFNHRLELAVSVTISEVTAINHFKIFFDKIYCIYHSSPKNKRKLEECCQELSMQFHGVGRMLDTRWVASSFCTIKAVWNLYNHLLCHLTKANEDHTRNSAERNSFQGMASKLTCEAFV